jgi:hypothetical protein
MTARAPELGTSGPASDREWRVQEHRIELRGATYRLRMARFPAGWLASIDTVEGPTLGCNASPYLAVSRAVEPIGGGLIDAMSIVSAFRQLGPDVGRLVGYRRRHPSVPRGLGAGAETHPRSAAADIRYRRR